jgi:hypothetical protein
MRNAWLACLLCSGLAGSVGAASAFPMGSVRDPQSFAIPTAAKGFTGPIPTEEHPITGAARIAKMRREGRLPDTFVRGRCTYELGGDPGVVFYVKSCR